MKRMRLALVAAPTVLALGAIGAGLPAGASVSPRLNLNATCSKGSIANLQVQREDNGRLSLDFGVDMARHRAGVPWAVHVTDNGTAVVNGTFRTGGDGSFSVTRWLPSARSSRIVATARNTTTGEVCRITATA
jgi:hypothetical protein